MDDASLDDFLTTDDDDDTGPEGSAEPGDAESGDAASEGTATDESGVDTTDDEGDTEGVSVDPSSVERASTTYDWSSDRVACERCGTAVDRRWRDDGIMVCADCKEW